MFVFIASFLMYLCLSWSEGLSLWEVATALLLALFVALAAPGASLNMGLTKGLNPFRWWLFLRHFFGPLAKGFLRASCETAYRIATGEVRPELVKVRPRLRNDLSRMMLANALTLTTGALTVDVDEDGSFCLHVLHASTTAREEAEDVCAALSGWVRRVAE